LAVAVLAAVPPATFGNGSASSGYADWPLAVIYLCALVAAHEYTRTGSAGAARLAGVTLMLGIWTKADAIVLLVCIAAVIAPRVVRWREWRMGLLVLLPGLSMQFLWSVVLVLTKASPDNGFQSHPHFGYLGILCRDAMLEFFKWKQWSLFWPLLALAVPLFIARRQLREAAPWVSGVLLPLVLYPLVFIFSAWNPVEDHVFSALPRLYLQIVPAAILFIALALYGVFEDSKRMRSDAE
jgi:hypothetical protein